MSHRKHFRAKGELVATTADPQKKPQKCQKAYNNRQSYKKEYINIPITLTIGDTIATETSKQLRQLRSMQNLRYFITILSIRKELSSFEAADYLKKGFKVEIVEG